MSEDLERDGAGNEPDGLHHDEIVTNLLSLQARLRGNGEEPTAPLRAAPAPMPAPVIEAARATLAQIFDGEPASEGVVEVTAGDLTVIAELQPEPEPEPEPQPAKPAKSDGAKSSEAAPAIVVPDPDVEAIAERLARLELELLGMGQSIGSLRDEVGDRVARLREDLWPEVEDVRTRLAGVEGRLLEVLATHREYVSKALDEHFAKMSEAISRAWSGDEL